MQFLFYFNSSNFLLMEFLHPTLTSNDIGLSTNFYFEPTSTPISGDSVSSDL